MMIIEEHHWEIRNRPPIQEQSLILEPSLNLLLIAAELHFGTSQKDAHSNRHYVPCFLVSRALKRVKNTSVRQSTQL